LSKAIGGQVVAVEDEMIAHVEFASRQTLVDDHVPHRAPVYSICSDHLTSQSLWLAVQAQHGATLSGLDEAAVWHGRTRNRSQDKPQHHLHSLLE
jgi:hypothetical protein